MLIQLIYPVSTILATIGLERAALPVLQLVGAWVALYVSSFIGGNCDSTGKNAGCYVGTARNGAQFALVAAMIVAMGWVGSPWVALSIVGGILLLLVALLGFGMAGVVVAASAGN